MLSMHHHSIDLITGAVKCTRIAQSRVCFKTWMLKVAMARNSFSMPPTRHSEVKCGE